MDQLDIYVEFFKDVDYNSFNQDKVHFSDEINNISDFYNKVQRLPFNVRKFSLEIKNALNDCELSFRDHPIEADDSFEFEYRFKDLGSVNQNLYMEFLHNAYKVDDILLSSLTVGNWNSFKFDFSPV